MPLLYHHLERATTEKLIIRPLALGEKTAKMQLFLAGSGSTLDNAFNDNKPGSSIEVEVVALDSELEDLGTPVDFIKIDVEGFELQVLKGAENIITRQHPVLLIEIADHIRGRKYRNRNYKNTLEWLEKHGYTIYKCTEDFRLTSVVSATAGANHLAMYLSMHTEKHISLIQEMVLEAKRQHHIWLMSRLRDKLQRWKTRIKNGSKKFLRLFVQSYFASGLFANFIP